MSIDVNFLSSTALQRTAEPAEVVPAKMVTYVAVSAAGSSRPSIALITLAEVAY